MSHQVLSRKYRPQQFADLVGQDHVARILTNTIASDRVGHAYLFVGPRGVGKTSTARIFARSLNCSGRPLSADDIEPCGTCPSCVDIAAGSDLDVVEMDAASNNHVEDVRSLREQVGYATVRSPYRIWIVDEVHMLSMPAFNAFLKTLEEPPEQVKFLFCTTEEHKLPDTFKSRCQRVEFRPIPESAMADRLVALAGREGATLAPDLANAIASGALGGLRDGESLLEQLLAACPDGKISLADLDALAGRAPAALLKQLAGAIDAQDASAALDAADECLASGCKPGVLMDQWLDRVREEMIHAARTGEPVARLARAIDVLLAKRAHLRAGADGVLVTQVAAVELARLPDARDLDKLIGALRGAATAAPARERHPQREPSPTPAREREHVHEEESDPTPSGAGSSETGVAANVPTGTVLPANVPTGTVLPANVPTGTVLPANVPTGTVLPANVPTGTVLPANVPTGTGSPVGSGPVLARADATRRADPGGDGGGALDRAAIESNWPSFVEALRARDTRLASLIERLALGDVERHKVHLRMETEVDGARAMLARREIQIAFSQVANATYGTALAPVLDERVEPEEVANRATGPDLRDHAVVRLVTEYTRGRLLGVEQRGPTPDA